MAQGGDPLGGCSLNQTMTDRRCAQRKANHLFVGWNSVTDDIPFPAFTPLGNVAHIQCINHASSLCIIRGLFHQVRVFSYDSPFFFTYSRSDAWLTFLLFLWVNVNSLT